MKSFIQRKEELLRDLEKIDAELADKRIKKSYGMFGPVEAQILTDVFKDAVTRFYESYTPKLYKRQANIGARTGGLYDVLSITYTQNTSDGTDGVVYASGDRFATLYDWHKMHGGRDRKTGDVMSKEDMYNLVFVNGYHGGAMSIDDDKIDKWGAHPDAGTPYYRRRGFIKTESGKRVWHRWGRWGSAAFKSNISPIEDVAETIHSPYIVGVLNNAYQKTLDMAFDGYEDEVKKIIDPIVNDFYTGRR